MIATLRQRNFALLWTAGLISFTGDWVLRTALPFYVYQQTGSTLATATMVVAKIAPSVLLSSFVGVYVDRWNRKRILVVSNLLQMITVSFLILLGSGTSLWIAYLVALVQSTIGTFADPAENALLPRLVDQQHLLTANALNSLNNNLARLVGPPLGGALLAMFGLHIIVIVDALSFGGAAALVALIALPAPPRDADALHAQNPIPTLGSQWTAFWQEWREGLAAIRANPLIARLMSVLGVMTFGGTMFSPLYPAFAEDVLQAGAPGYGWLLAAQAIGGVAGGIMIGHLGVALPTARILAWGNLMIGFLLLLQFNLPLLPLALAISFVIGPEQVAAGAALQTLLQQSVADPLKGRVFGAMGTTGALLSMLGGAAAGQLGASMGVVPALNTAAGLTIVSGVLAWLLLPTATPQTGASHDAPARS
jgi:MFS family permease